MRADRLISILMLLQTRGRLTAQELAERLEVSERTIYRDLDALSAAGVPVYAERGPGGGCALLDSYRTNLTGLTEDELRALFMLSVPAPLADLGVSKTLEGAQLKLSAALSAGRRASIEQVRQRIYLDSATWFQPQEAVPYLEIVQSGVWQNQRLSMIYRRSDGNWIKRLLDPYGLVAKAGTWYVVGSMSGYPRVYRISRIQEAHLTGSTFQRPEDFDLTEFWKRWVERVERNRTDCSVTLRIAPQLVPTLAQIFGDGILQQIDQAGPPDDHGWLTLSLTFESVEEARARILGFGNLAEVLFPPDMRRTIVEMATRILTFYTLPESET